MTFVESHAADDRNGDNAQSAINRAVAHR